MKLDMSRLLAIKRQAGRFISSHSYSIYAALFMTALIIAVAGLNIILTKPSDEDYHTQKITELQSAQFDAKTIEDIKQLNTRQQTNTDPAPTGKRTNPFSE